MCLDGIVAVMLPSVSNKFLLRFNSTTEHKIFHKEVPSNYQRRKSLFEKKKIPSNVLPGVAFLYANLHANLTLSEAYLYISNSSCLMRQFRVTQNTTTFSLLKEIQY